MDGLLTYFIGVLGYNVAASLAAFGIVYYSRRRDLALTPGRGFAVFIGGWFIGSIIVVVLHVLAAYSTFNLKEGSLEIVISICVISAVMYPLFSWLCAKPNPSQSKPSGA